MPSPEQHHQQYGKNKKAIQDVGSLDRPPLDWLITMAFYSAVHLIEGVIAQKAGSFSQSHNDRKKAISMIKELKPIGAKYSTLESYSHKSRYLCKTFTDKDVNEVMGLLKDIEDNVKENK